MQMLPKIIPALFKKAVPFPNVFYDFQMKNLNLNFRAKVQICCKNKDKIFRNYLRILLQIGTCPLPLKHSQALGVYVDTAWHIFYNSGNLFSIGG